MITVEEADKIIREQVTDYGAEIVPFELALGRILAEDIKADRDLPPFNRVTMDGIAVKYDAIESGISTFRIKATQAAGNQPVDIEEYNECIEIMTGAVLPASSDTVIRYEDLELRAGLATLVTIRRRCGLGAGPSRLRRFHGGVVPELQGERSRGAGDRRGEGGVRAE